MERWEVKLVCGILMWISLLICFLLPLKVSDFFYRKGARGQHYLDVLSCFAGGVFLACYLLYMAPEVRLLIDENLLKPQGIAYPLPELLVAVGFFLLLFMERLVSSCHVETAEEAGSTSGGTSGGSDVMVGDHVVVGSETRAVIFYLAMSIDSVFEGMAIGLQRTSYQVWMIFIGIISHEVVITFCLGLQVVNNLRGRMKAILVFGFVYSLMNPAGVLLTAILYETREANPTLELANGIVQALAAGVFIYVTFYECLEGQIERKTPWSKLFAIFIGFGAMAAFAAIPKETPTGGESMSLTNVTEMLATS